MDRRNTAPSRDQPRDLLLTGRTRWRTVPNLYRRWCGLCFGGSAPV